MRKTEEFRSLISDFIDKGDACSKSLIDNIEKVKEVAAAKGLILGKSFVGHNSYAISPQKYQQNAESVSKQWDELKIKLLELSELLSKM